MKKKIFPSPVIFGTLVLYLSIGIGCGSGFENVNNPSGSTKLTGRALKTDRTPAEGVWAYLVKDGQAVAWAKSDEKGRFKIGADMAGTVDIVLNDSAGRGALKTMPLYNGDNDAGDMFLQPLESIAPVVDMRGVGYEERVTKERGDYIKPVYNSDRSAAFAGRKLGGESNWQIVRIDLPSGTETVLREDEKMYTNTSKYLQLLSDDVLYYQAYRTIKNDDYPEGILTEHSVFIDTHTGKELLAVVWWRFRAGPFMSGDRICYLDGPERQFAYDTIFGTAYEYRLQPTCLDVSTGKESRGPMIQGWCTSAQVLASNSKSTAFLKVRDCDEEDPDCNFDKPSPMYLVNWSDLSNRYISSFNYYSSWAVETAWDGKNLYYLNNDQTAAHNYELRLLKVDIASGQTVQVGSHIFDCKGSQGTTCPYNMKVSPDRSELLVPMIERTQNESHSNGLYKIDLATGKIAAMDTTFTIDGKEYSLCKTGNYPVCNQSFETDGSVSIEEVFTSDDGDGGARTGIRAVIDTDGSSMARAFPLGEADYHVPEIITGPRNKLEMVRVRDLETGFFQLHAGDKGSDLASMNQVTFITASHSYPTFAPDGEHLYYFTRDPISGYEQLFTVSLKEPERDGSK
ncbi:MAG: hypothetical protein GXP49_10420 [Deltaproteobacteria bacterium]|nr:hypothetical protein [Deltaproteobacteria bacterium]